MLHITKMLCKAHSAVARRATVYPILMLVSLKLHTVRVNGNKSPKDKETNPVLIFYLGAVRPWRGNALSGLSRISIGQAIAIPLVSGNAASRKIRFSGMGFDLQASDNPIRSSLHGTSGLGPQLAMLRSEYATLKIGILVGDVRRIADDIMPSGSQRLGKGNQLGSSTCLRRTTKDA